MCVCYLSLRTSRWLRLLFGREFSLPDLLVLWDAFFADGSAFTLTSYVVVAMLVLIRPKCKQPDAIAVLSSQ